ncbi:hypothetical protein [Streptomyces sp. NPDC005209]
MTTNGAETEDGNNPAAPESGRKKGTPGGTGRTLGAGLGPRLRGERGATA